MKHLSKYLIVSLVASVACFFLLSGTSSAATITVASGNDENTDNASCALTEAIENINDGAQTNTDCVETGSYGTDDTIILPTGTITLSANLPHLAKSIAIQGAGMGETIIDGDGQWQVFGNAPGSELDIAISRLSITAFDGGAIIINDSNLTATQLDIDGVNGITTFQVQGGIGFLNNTSGETKNFTVEDVYIHDFSSTFDGNALIGVVAAVDSQGTVNATLQRVTVSNLSNTGNDTQIQGIGFATGVFGGFGAGTISAAMDNVTISGLTNSDGTGTSGISAISGLNAGSATANISLDIINSTVTDISAAESNLFPGRYGTSLAVSTAAAQATDVVNVDINVTNTVLSNLLNSPSENCEIASFAPMFSGVGVENVSITSAGGNLSDDSSCAPYFTEPTDQNNVSGLAASLSPLADNGGYVPTMALLEGSPAVDSGVTVAGLTTDARGATRPQGSAYDSGAYESPFTKPATDTTDTTASLAESGSMILGILAIAAIIVGGGLVVVGNAQRQGYTNQ